MVRLSITLSDAHADALAVIMADGYSDAGGDVGKVFEQMIMEYLLREGGSLGKIVHGEYTD